MVFARVVLWLAASSPWAVGCASDDAARNVMEDADGGIGCQDDPRAESYVAELAHPGESGLLTFVLTSSDPAPPSKGKNRWILEIHDADGTSVRGANVTVVPFMPNHGHGTQLAPVITPDGERYLVTPVYLFMAGLWQVTIRASWGEVTDQAVFTFCIQG